MTIDFASLVASDKIRSSLLIWSFGRSFVFRTRVFPIKSPSMPLHRNVRIASYIDLTMGWPLILKEVLRTIGIPLI